MKKLFLIALAIPFMCLAVGSVSGQRAAVNKDSALLYEVTGKKLTKPSYILGTFHAICTTEMLPIEKLTVLIDKTDQLVLELDLDDPAVKVAMGGSYVMKDGKTLKDLYTAEQYAKVEEMIKNATGLPLDAVKTFKPFMLSFLVSTSPKTLGCETGAVDSVVMNAAIKMNKPVIGLESVATQIAVLDSIPLEKQAKDLYDMAADPQKSLALTRLMMAAYKAQDSDKLLAITDSEMKNDAELIKKALVDRNHSWIPLLKKIFAEKPSFVAVGAGHLSGKDGIMKLLKAEGYNVKAIRF